MKNTSSPLNSRTLKLSALGVGLALLVLLLMLSPGCQSGRQRTMQSNSSEVYSLVSVDGKTLPCTLAHGNTTMTIKSGAFTINSDGTCSSAITMSIAGRDVQKAVQATYVREGNALTMKWQRAGTTVGHLDGDRFIMNNEGSVFSYRK